MKKEPINQMKTTLLKTEQGIALEIDGVVSDCKLDLTAVAEQIGELWGIFDVSYYKQEILKTAKAIFNGDAPDTDAAYIGGLTKGLDAMEKVFTEIINKEKLFTETDIRIIRNKLVDLCPKGDVTVADLEKHIKDHTNWTDEYINLKLRPDRVECTVEMEYPIIDLGFHGGQMGDNLQPKITNNTIKVLTIIK